MSTPAEPHSFSRSRQEAGLSRAVLQVAKSLAATLGSDFFQSAVKHLAAAFQADCAYLGELTNTPTVGIRAVAISGKRRANHFLDHELTGTAVGHVMAEGSLMCSKEVRLIFPEDRWLEKMFAEGYAGIRLSDADGQPIGLLAIVARRPLTDIRLVKSVLETFAPRTAAELARKRADEVHRENEERYHAFVATNPDAMWRIEFEQPVPLNLPEDAQLELIHRYGYLAECNEALAQVAGRSVAQLNGSRLAEFEPLTGAAFVEELRASIRSGFQPTSTETTVRDKGGRQLHRIRSQFGIVEGGELRRLWGTTRDITDLKRAEGSVAAFKRGFQEVLEGVHLLAVILDPQGAITFCNDSFVQLTQRSRAELAALEWLHEVVASSEARIWKAAMQSDQDRQQATTHFEGTIFPRNGEPRTIQWDTTCLRNQDGELTALAAIGRDLTYQNALEMRFREAQKLDGIGRVAAGVAHDFNNLLMVILGHVAQLHAQVPEGSPHRADIAAIEYAATQCTRLTSQLLTFGRRQHLQPQYLTMNEVITAAEGLIRTMAGESVELVIDLASPAGIVYADPTQIQRVLANLVTNARDAMPQGGRLTIATSNIEVVEQDTTYLAIKPGSYVRLSVTDTGIGLSDEVRAHLFEPLFTTKDPEKGTGLGLATVYGIVTQSGGHIAVRGELGRGATFDILLPAVSRKA